MQECECQTKLLLPHVFARNVHTRGRGIALDVMKEFELI